MNGLGRSAGRARVAGTWEQPQPEPQETPWMPAGRGRGRVGNSYWVVVGQTRARMTIEPPIEQPQLGKFFCLIFVYVLFIFVFVCFIFCLFLFLFFVYFV